MYAILKRAATLTLPTLCAMLAMASAAEADVTIIGALSNFDCPNNTPEVCDEFEFELEGPHTSDCYGTWGNYNYGPGVVAANAAGTGIIVTYKRVGRTTAIGAIEHFGVHLTNFNLITARTFRWKHNGALVTSGPGGLPPVIFPVVTITPATPTTPPEVVEAVENESPEDVIWVRRKTIKVPRAVDLAELMPDDPLITSATNVSVELEKLEPGETLESAEPIEPEDHLFTQIIVVETYNDIATWNPATQDWDHAPGTTLQSRAMNATISEVPACADLVQITAQPQNATAAPSGNASFSISVIAPTTAGGPAYQWRKDGIDIPDTDNPVLDLEDLTAADEGAYTCIITNDCGMTESLAAWLTVTTPCIADFDHSGQTSIDDLFLFLNAWFTGSSSANVNGSQGVTIDDLFLFFNVWFTGC